MATSTDEIQLNVCWPTNRAPTWRSDFGCPWPDQTHYDRDQEFDFANSQLSERLSELSQRAYGFKEFWQAPPTDAVYFHRKLGGMFLLASRIKARVNVRELLQKFL